MWACRRTTQRRSLRAPGVPQLRMLSAAGCGAVGTGVGVYDFLSTTFLTAPLKIPCHRHEGHAHIKPQMLFISIPFAERFGTLVIFAEWHYDSDSELPVFPIVIQRNDIQVFTPADFLAP